MTHPGLGVRTPQERIAAAKIDFLQVPHKARAQDLKTRLVDNGFDPEFLTDPESRAFVVREIRKWRQAVKDAGAK